MVLAIVAILSLGYSVFLIKEMINDKKIDGEITFLMAILFLFVDVIVIMTVSTFTGLYENYRVGKTTVKIVDYNYGGLIFKTHDIEGVLVDKEYMKGNTNSFRFSTGNEEIGKQLESLNNTVVEVEYNEWLVNPSSQGDQGSLIIKKITPVTLEKKN
jgi:hypothetical protein